MGTLQMVRISKKKREENIVSSPCDHESKVQVTAYKSIPIIKGSNHKVNY